MIDQKQVPQYIENALPAMPHHTADQSQEEDAYEAMQALTSYTTKNIQAHDYHVVKGCFQVAEKLYSKGNSIVKNAVQNVFIYSLTKIFHTYSAEKKQLIALLPLSLYSLYVSQIYHRGC